MKQEEVLFAKLASHDKTLKAVQSLLESTDILARETANKLQKNTINDGHLK